jgi:hypothetical protein
MVLMAKFTNNNIYLPISLKNGLENGASPACCDSLGQVTPTNDMHPQCLPIKMYQGMKRKVLILSFVSVF